MLLQVILRIEAVKLAGKKIPQVSNLNSIYTWFSIYIRYVDHIDNNNSNNDNNNNNNNIIIIIIIIIIITRPEVHV